MDDDTKSAAKKAKYSHINGDDGFQQRSAAVFSCLDRLEPARESEPKRTGRRFPRQVPDHVVHPEKWTKYSLEDDGTSGLQGVSGDAANRNIALSFLEDLRKRRASESNESAAQGPKAGAGQAKPVFSAKSKVEAAKATELCAERQSRVKDGVNVMPEYVVGKTPKKGAAAPARVRQEVDGRRTAAEQKQAVGLEHLQDEQEELEEPSAQAEEQRAGAPEGKVAFAKRKSRPNTRQRGVEAVEPAGSNSA